MQEQPQSDWVTLEAVKAKQVLVHHGVGERRDCPFPARLEFDTRGVGMLVPTRPELDKSVWVNSLFTYSLHAAQVDGKQRLAIWNAASQESRWRDDEFGNRLVRPVALGADKPQGFLGEVYLYTLSPCSKGPRVFFTMPYIDNYVFQGGKHNRWVCRSLPRWFKILDEAGFDGAPHFIKSNKAVLSADAQAPAEVASAGQEYACSGLAATLLLAHWACTNKQVSAENKVAAAKLLNLIVERFVGSGQFVLHCEDPSGRGVDIVYEDGACKLHSPSNGVPPSQLLQAKHFSRFAGTLVDLFLQLHTTCLKVVRAGAKCKSMALSMQRVVASCIHNCIEDAVGALTSDSIDHTRLPVLRSGKGLRARRVPQGLKRAMADLAHRSPGVKDVRQLVAGGRALAGKRARASDLVSLRAAGTFVQDNQLLYLTTCRRALADEKHFSVSLDGVRAGGEDVLMAALYCPRLGHACWLAPQAQLSTPMCVKWRLQLVFSILF